MAWPANKKILGSTPFIGIVQKGSATGLGSQALSRLEPVVRVDLPRDAISGLPLLFGRVELTMPSMERMARGRSSSEGRLLSEDFEVRLFCSNQQKVIGWIGEPVPLTVVRDCLPPPLEALQVRFEGRNAMLRWGTLDLQPFALGCGIERVRLNMRHEGKQRSWCLDPDATEWEVPDLQPDTEYEFQARLENLAGAGREVALSCRTNALCAAPAQVACEEVGTMYVSLRFASPKTIGNEATKDRFQIAREKITCFEATLKVEDDDQHAAGGGGRRASWDDDKSTANLRKCRWKKEQWTKDAQEVVHVRLGGLRPDTRYALDHLCALNSMGAGAKSPRLVFWTIPQTPRISGLRVRQGLVLVALSQQGGLAVKDYCVAIFEGDDEEEQSSFTLPRSNLSSEHTSEYHPTPELSLDFDRMPATSTKQRFKVRAMNPGGWSEWSAEFETVAVMRQQGAEEAQSRLIRAVKNRNVDDLRQTLQDVGDLELPNECHRQEAISLLELLQNALERLASASRARYPEPLREALAVAREVELPNIDKAEKLLRKLDAVVEGLNTAKGIQKLREALKTARETKLPEDLQLQQEAISRLSTREAAEVRLAEAIEGARVPPLQAALDSAVDMHLPSEVEGRTLLRELMRTESMLHAALQSKLIGDLQQAVQAARACGLREDALIGENSRLLDRLLREQQAALRKLQAHVEEKHPERLREMILAARSAQVTEKDLQVAEALLERLDNLVKANVDAVNRDARLVALEAAREALLPEQLLEPFVEQYESLGSLHEALERGHVEVLRQRLRRAEDAKVKPIELAEARVVYADWSAAEREVQASASLCQTAQLRSAISRASSLGIADDQLERAERIHEALLRRDASEKALLQATREREVETIQEAYKCACDDEVGNFKLLQAAYSLEQHLSQLRTEVATAMQHEYLCEAKEVLDRASAPPALPEPELEPLASLVEELQNKERDKLVEEMQETVANRDWRGADWLLRRHDKSKAAGAEVHDMLIGLARKVSQEAQCEDNARFENDLKVERSRRNYTQWEEEAPTAVERAPIPAVAVVGEMALMYEPCGVYKYTFPRELVEGYLVVKIEEELRMEAAAAASAFAGVVADPRPIDARVMEQLTRGLRRLLPKEDDLLEYEDTQTVLCDDGVARPREPGTRLHKGRLDREIAVYVRAPHASADIAAALVTRGELGQDSLIGPEDVKPEEASNGRAGAAKDEDECTRFARELSAGLTEAVQSEHSAPRTSQRGRRLAEHTRDIRSRMLRRVTVVLSWDYPRGLLDLLDFSCFVFDPDRLVDIIDDRHKQGGWPKFANRQEDGAVVDRTNGAIRHEGVVLEHHQRKGRQVIQLRLDFMPSSISDLVFMLSTYGKDTIKFKSIKLTFYDTDTMRVLTSFDVESESGNFESGVICSLYRMNDGLWRANSFGCRCAGNARKYQPIVSKLFELGFPRHSWLRQQVPSILESIQRQFRIDPGLIAKVICDAPPKSPGRGGDAAGVAKAAGLQIVASSSADPLKSEMQLRFAVELFGIYVDRGADMARIAGRKAFHNELLKALRLANATAYDDRSSRAGDRLTERHLAVQPVSVKILHNVEFRLSWNFPPLARGGVSLPCLDGTCAVFEEQGLREVVDYRGAHGVRIVQGGVLDYAGVWLGKVGVSDAAGKAVRFANETVDHVGKRGEHAIGVRFDILPRSATDLYFVLSSPTLEEASNFKDLRIRLVDADNPAHEIAQFSVTPQAHSKAVVMCGVSADVSSGVWRLDTFGARANGSAKDYRPIIACLRAMQEKRHARKAQWPCKMVEQAGREFGRGVILPVLPSAKGGKPERRSSKASVRSTRSDATQLSSWSIVNPHVHEEGDTPPSSEEASEGGDAAPPLTSMSDAMTDKPRVSLTRRFSNLGDGLASLRRATMGTS
eukprot:TRINITY_DN28687_c0_g4_i2.p1 TRINITY_DN28687_c0_g4~~TRINITY_DN28687_c0_g4_i2.p1  ORF type:complete len:1960 (-),score=560.78 TRINITY_DN28687_c0_g4_i2:54-5786(-)